MKKENFSLHLKTLDKVKVFDVEMQFDEDTEIDKFSMFIDGEKLELTGNAESIFMELSKILKDKYEISWTDVEIINDENGKPYAHFINKTYKEIEQIDISISHIKEYATASHIWIIKNNDELANKAYEDLLQTFWKNFIEIFYFILRE